MALQDLMTWIAFIGMAVLGISAVIGYFDKDKRAKRKDENDVEDRLIKLFKTEIEQLEKKIADLEKKTESQAKTIQNLQSRATSTEETNKLLKDILMGRDEESQEYKQKAMDAINKVDQNTRKIDRIENGNKEILNSINNLYKLLEKHLANEKQMLDKIGK